jgi:hypothetical protein
MMTGLVNIFLGIPVYGIRSVAFAAMSILPAIAVIIGPKRYVPSFLLPYKIVLVETDDHDFSWYTPDLERQIVDFVGTHFDERNGVYYPREPSRSLPPPTYEEALNIDQGLANELDGK